MAEFLFKLSLVPVEQETRNVGDAGVAALKEFFFDRIEFQVTETQKQLINLKKNLRPEEKRMKVDKVYLHFLGLSDDTE